MRNVFIPQLPTRFDKATNQRVPTIDTNPASEFGELVTMFGADVHKDRALDEAMEKAAAIGPADYILAVGDVALLAVITAGVLRRNGRATLLRWDSENRKYREQEVIG